MTHHQCARCKVWVLPHAEFQLNEEDWLCPKCFVETLKKYITEGQLIDLAVNDIEERDRA